jgi:hypothetical protein
MDAMDQFEKAAHDMVAGTAAKQAFDISQESTATRERYGRHTWGQSTLLARRLVEAGVTFVTCHFGGWDHHWDLQKGYDNYLPKIDQLVSAALREPRFNTALIGAFGVLAVLLASVGLYAVISYSVTQRTHEIGVRMAVGAGQRDIFNLIVGQGMKLTLIGVAIGLAASFALTRVMLSMLFEVSATDPLTFAGLSLLLTFVSLLACYVPARRAMKVDPMAALRHE